tara:strand:- start:162 stop:317 length:156 start_codon:yes stop_codon:yes gene_type:complete
MKGERRGISPRTIRGTIKSKYNHAVKAQAEINTVDHQLKITHKRTRLKRID